MVSINGVEVQIKLVGSVPERICGGIIFIFGLVYVVRVFWVVLVANIDQTTISGIELAPMISDFVVCPAWIIGGIQLYRRKILGYVSGLGLLFQASMLFIALIIYMLVQPSLTGAEFSLIDLIVVFIMGFICFIPTGLFIRGIARNSGE